METSQEETFNKMILSVLPKDLDLWTKNKVLQQNRILTMDITHTANPSMVKEIRVTFHKMFNLRVNQAWKNSNHTFQNYKRD